MELLVSSLTHLPEIISAVVLVLGGQKGYAVYMKKRFSNGNHDRRRGNTFADSDKEFIRGCMLDQSRSMKSLLETDRLALVMKLGDVIRDDGDKTRTAVRGA